MKFNHFLLLLILLSTATKVYAKTFTVSGYITDAETGETLIGANVVIYGQNRGAATDRNGYFRIAGLSSGKYRLVISYIGYEKKELQITILNKSLILKDISLHPKAIDVQDIVVTAKRSEFSDIEIETSHLKISPRAIKSIPTSNDDVFRALKYLPGIEGIDPFSPIFSARGSDPGENMVLLDGVTIYNPYHFVTASGLFNLYAIKNIEMLVGGFGAEYGGKNSSVLYLTTREGNNKSLHGEFETNTSQTRAVFDFPINKNITMMISGRVYYELVPLFIFDMPSYFYDMNISLNWKLNQQNKLMLRYFYSRDLFDYSFARFSSYFANTFDTDLFDNYDVIYKNRWSNQAATAILKTIISPKIYLQTQFSGSFFSSKNCSIIDYEYTDDENNTMKILYRMDINNKINDLSVKSILSIILNSTNSMKLGVELNHYYFNNHLRINHFEFGKAVRKPNLLAGFFEDKVMIGALTIRPGMRFSKFSYNNQWYQEPRVNTSLNLPQHTKLKIAWGKYFQYIVSMNTHEYEISQFLENYYPLKNKKPSSSTHYILGVEKLLTSNSHISIDFYYKDIFRVYTFDPDLTPLEAIQFPDKLRAGSGKSFGVEFLWQGTWKRFSGWLSYGISKSTRSYPHIMKGKSFYFDYDRTHVFKAVMNHQIHPYLSYSGTLRILSGVPITLERSINSYFYYDPKTERLARQGVFIADNKNNARLPLYIQLDLGLKKRIRKGFAAELAEFLGAKESYFHVKFGNLLFLRRNVWFYIPMGKEKYYAVGNNYIPDFGMGYTIKF